MMDVITINRDDASRACAKTIHEFFQSLNESEYGEEFYARKMIELTLFSAMFVSNLFKDMEEEDK